jgi:uncharacterized protein with HEPN domain
MKKDWRIHAAHILEGCEIVWSYWRHLQRDQAIAGMAFDAILRRLETITEAASKKYSGRGEAASSRDRLAACPGYA